MIVACCSCLLLTCPAGRQRRTCSSRIAGEPSRQDRRTHAVHIQARKAQGNRAEAMLGDICVESIWSSPKFSKRSDRPYVRKGRQHVKWRLEIFACGLQMQWICISRWQKLGADVCILLAACSRLEVAVRSAFQGMSSFVIEVP